MHHFHYRDGVLHAEDVCITSTTVTVCFTPKT